MTSVTIALSACTGPLEPSCYRIYGQVGRTLTNAPCPPDRQGVLKDEELPTH